MHDFILATVSLIDDRVGGEFWNLLYTIVDRALFEH